MLALAGAARPSRIYRCAPVLKAGIAHLWFVTIHPFDDGNGRIARAIAEIVRLTQEPPPHEATHWTVRAMAKAVGVAASTVQAI